ncbi:hypothetical protein [Xylocopilactobacillus apicola]|uniref:Uncharacterized protein n=1 Tax=Xylocopilactobacillus apicola TaxID=2932184 RepID=A0AAU9DQF8_9LACO|nr:hypothetical protein [Xylocopilactobacillus apicola]BDR58114.1 hypothetical protein XA3_05550 [Xylocopilactobacillus apicola]
MKKTVKNSFTSLVIVIMALVIFGGSFVVSSKLKKNRDVKRVQNMYHLLSTKGKLHTERNAYTYLTTVGKERLQPNLTFDAKGVPANTLTAFSEENVTLTPYHYEGTLKLPENPTKGQRLYFKAPFPITINENLVMTIYFKNKSISYDSTNILLKSQKKKHQAYLYLGESSDSDGKLIDDISTIKAQSGETVRFKLTNVERSFDSVSDRKLIKHPALFYSRQELLDKPELTLKVGYHVDQPKFHFVMQGYQDEDLIVKVISNQPKNYQRKIRIQLIPKGKLLADLKSDSPKDYQFSLLYNGLVIKDQYYITNNLSSLSNFNNGK